MWFSVTQAELYTDANQSNTEHQAESDVRPWNKEQYTMGNKIPVGVKYYLPEFSVEQQLKNSLCCHKKRHTIFLLLEVQSTLQQASSNML